MVPLFTHDVLFVTVDPEDGLNPRGHLTVLDVDRAEVAQVVDTASGATAWTRMALGSRKGRFEWEVRDAAGNRILGVVKPKSSARGPRPEVSLADGTLLGRAEPTARWGNTCPVRMLAPDGSDFGRLEYALGEGRREFPLLMYGVHDRDGHQVGEVAYQPHGEWGFHITFAPEAGLSIRAMTLAWTVCLVQQRTGTSSL